MVLAALAVVTRDFGHPKPNPPGTFSFAVFGDAPYYAWEVPRFRVVLREVDGNDIAWLLHVGDIFWRPCTDEHYRWVLSHLDSLRHPVIYTPGDNESFDCWEPGSGGYAPQDRFARIRQIFFSNPTHSLGKNPMPVASQAGEFVENLRWIRSGIVFATVDMIGSENGVKPFPARRAGDDAASRRRTETAAAWVRETFAEAKRANASAVVLAFHAEMGWEKPPSNPYRQAFEPFISTVEEEAAAFRRPVLLVHGDGHKYRVDHPLVLRNVTRMEVPGSPDVGWVRVAVKPDAPNPFTFEKHIVPRWKIW